MIWSSGFLSQHCFHDVSVHSTLAPLVLWLRMLKCKYCSSILRTNKQRQVEIKSYLVDYCSGFMGLIAFGVRALCLEWLMELVFVWPKFRQLWKPQYGDLNEIEVCFSNQQAWVDNCRSVCGLTLLLCVLLRSVVQGGCPSLCQRFHTETRGKGKRLLRAQSEHCRCRFHSHSASQNLIIGCS